MRRMSKKMKDYEIEVPVDGRVQIYRTDLVCNSCGKKLGDGEYLYFCMKDKDDLCSNYNCLKKHAGHRFFRWGRVELGVKTTEGPQINTASRIGPPSTASKLASVLTHTLPSLPAGPPAAPPGKTLGVPLTPLGAPPAAPAEASVIKAGLPAFTTLRDDMLKELKRLKTIMEDDSQGGK